MAQTPLTSIPATESGSLTVGLVRDQVLQQEGRMYWGHKDVLGTRGHKQHPLQVGRARVSSRPQPPSLD